MWAVSVVVLLCGTLNTISAACPKECQCSHEVPRCASGVSLMLDSCGCCKVCARQLNEDCSKSEPCDHIKGLECNYGAGYGTTKGICRAKSDGRPCEYNNRIYQNGESFHPNCKHQCICMDGAVGCVSLCPHELSLPKLGCAKPRLVKVPGRCCEELVCPEGSQTGIYLAKKHSKDAQSEDDLTRRNELIPVSRGQLKSLPAFRSEPAGRMLSRGMKCVARTTDWSPCSRSCGTGVSSRTTRSNSLQCKPTKETRICEVRPCTQSAAVISLKNGQKCGHIEKASHPVKLSYMGCRSLKRFRPRYCGSCVEGHCCSPQQTQTVPVRFRCEEGVTFSKSVMVIQSCKCDLDCPRENNKPDSGPFYRLLHDLQRVKG